VSPPAPVIDTSYLLELYAVPSFSKPQHHAEVKARFLRAADAGSRLYLPFPAIFEVANHIVDGRDDGARNALARRFVDDMIRSFERTEPFVITPAVSEASLKALLHVFSSELSSQRVGLTDGAIIEEARQLKRKYGALARVHIWTKDRRLKAHEPDAEAAPFVL
jgi:predicted nucleic acid-binding protein